MRREKEDEERGAYGDVKRDDVVVVDGEGEVVLTHLNQRRQSISIKHQKMNKTRKRGGGRREEKEEGRGRDEGGGILIGSVIQLYECFWWNHNVSSVEISTYLCVRGERGGGERGEKGRETEEGVEMYGIPD